MGINTLPVPAGSIATGNISLIASGNLSGASVTLTGLSNYQTLNMQVYGSQNSGYPADSWYWYLNGDTSSVYQQLSGSFAKNESPTGGVSGNYSNITANGNYFNVDGYNIRVWDLSLTNCKTLGYTNFDTWGFFPPTSGNWGHVQTSGAYQVNSTISSITFRSASGTTMVAGSYVLYGG
jgi:hypothetical protein